MTVFHVQEEWNLSHIARLGVVVPYLPLRSTAENSDRGSTTGLARCRGSAVTNI